MADLTNCDREPIHIPGTVLPYGAMLVLDPETLEILQAGGDTRGLIGHEPTELLGKEVSSLLKGGQIDHLKALCAASQLAKPRHLLDPALRVLPARPVDASAHRSDGLLMLEFEDADPDSPHAADPLACVQDRLDGFDALTSILDFCQHATGRVRAVAGYDRVMIYRFQEDASGVVIAEARRDDLVLTWRASGGPEVVPPTRRGFGSTLIERAMSIETGGRSSLRFDPTGVVCEVTLPPEAVLSSQQPQETAPSFVAPVSEDTQAPAKPRVLIVEDAALVLMTLELLVESLGWTIVGPATRLADALSIVATEEIDVALLDINLNGKFSWPVADLLSARGVPFAFTTGYGGATILPERLAGRPIVGKPFSAEEIEACLRGMVGAKSQSAISNATGDLILVDASQSLRRPE